MRKGSPLCGRSRQNRATSQKKMKEARWEKKSIGTEKHAPCGSSHRPPPSNPGRAKFSLISLKKFNQPLTWNGELVLGERGRERGVWETNWVMQLVRMSCIASVDRITLLGRTPFFHVNTSALLPETRWLKLCLEPVCFRSAERLVEGQFSQLVTSYNAP